MESRRYATHHDLGNECQLTRVTCLCIRWVGWRLGWLSNNSRGKIVR